VFVVDTNVLVYAADRSSPFHERCRSHLLQWRAQPTPWFLTWSIVYEFLRITTHPRVFRTPWPAAKAWEFIEALLESPGLAVLVEGGRHDEILAQMISAIPDLKGNLVHDAHTATLMQEHGIRVIYTRDTDFHRFPSLEVRDPLA